MSLQLDFFDESVDEVSAPPPEPVPPFLPLVDWLEMSPARSLVELEPWQLWQLSWFGRCRVPRG